MKHIKTCECIPSLSPVELKNAPTLLFYAGDIALLKAQKNISIIGSRNVSDKGIKRTRFISEHLVNQNITIVSGLAQGVDTTAHSTALNSGGRTIAVIGTPIDQCYPKTNLILQQEIMSHHLCISQFPEGSEVKPRNFVQRNLTMALISAATIITEASEQSGTRHQGWETLRLGRKLFLMENLITESKISWAKEMLDEGAQIITRDNYEGLIKEIPSIW